MALYDSAKIIRTGVWLYDGTVPAQVRLVRNLVTYGSGDYEDRAEIREDRDRPCYVLLFGIPGNIGEFRWASASGQYETMEAALAGAEKLVPGIIWNAG
jgi:hypothetical protein